MTLRTNAITGTQGYSDRTTSFPQAKLEENKIISRKGTISDVTNIIKEQGLDHASDIICCASDEVAVQQINPHRPPYFSTTTKILLKVTENADIGLHELLITGYSSTKNQIASIQLNIDVQGN